MSKKIIIDSVVRYSFIATGVVAGLFAIKKIGPANIISGSIKESLQAGKQVTEEVKDFVAEETTVGAALWSEDPERKREASEQVTKTVLGSSNYNKLQSIKAFSNIDGYNQFQQPTFHKDVWQKFISPNYDKLSSNTKKWFKDDCKGGHKISDNFDVRPGISCGWFGASLPVLDLHWWISEFKSMGWAMRHSENHVHTEYLKYREAKIAEIKKAYEEIELTYIHAWTDYQEELRKQLVEDRKVTQETGGGSGGSTQHDRSSDTGKTEFQM
jgi:hypothetical protein